MKFLILLLSLFAFLSFTPTTVLAVANPRIYAYTSLDFKPKTEEPKPKWVKVLELMVPIFLVLGILLFFSSFNYGLWLSILARPLNYRLSFVSLAIAASSAITLFVFRMITLIKKRK